jgi:hypothetical protein
MRRIPPIRSATVVTVAEHQRRLNTPPSPPCSACDAAWTLKGSDWCREHTRDCATWRRRSSSPNGEKVGAFYPTQECP